MIVIISQTSCLIPWGLIVNYGEGGYKMGRGGGGEGVVQVTFYPFRKGEGIKSNFSIL